MKADNYLLRTNKHHGYITTRKPCCRRESARCRCNFRSIDQDMISKDQWRTDFKLSYVTYLLNL